MRSISRMEQAPVVDMDSGRIIGRVRRVVIQPDRKKVAGFLIDRNRMIGRYGFVAFEHVATVGEHALLVRGDVFEKAGRDPQSQPKLRAFDCDGYEVGTVQDILFHEKSGNVEKLEISGGLWGDIKQGRVYAERFAKMEFSEDLVVWPDAVKGMLKAENKKRGDEG